LRAYETKEKGGKFYAEEVGILYIDFRVPHHFTHEEQQIISIFAHQVANVIRGARLFTEEQRQAIELKAVQQTAVKILAQEDLNSLLDALVHEATKLCGTGGKSTFVCRSREAAFGCCHEC
jgi:GAF domain-containing protein